MKARFLLLLLLAFPAAAQRIASDFEIAQMERQVASSRDFLAQVSGHLNLGDLRLTRSEPALARSEYTRALDAAAAERVRARRVSDLARYATATMYEGLADAKLGRAADSFSLFEEALRYASDDAKSWNLYSTAMGIVHLDGKAIAAARNAVAIAESDAGRDPLDLAVYRYSLAAALIDGGEGKEAERLLVTVVGSLRSKEFDTVKTDVARSEAFEIYSTARGDTAAYLSLLNRAQLRLATLYESRGDTPAARKQYENVLATRSDDVTALAALARLSSDAESERYYAAAFDANPFSPSLIREYRRHAHPDASDTSTPGGAMRTALQQLDRGERHAARATLETLAKKFPDNATIPSLMRETQAPAGAELPSPTPSAAELRRFIDAFESLTPDQRATLDRLTFTSTAIFDGADRGTIEGVPFRLSAPTSSAGAATLTYRILGASGDELLIEVAK